MVSGVCEDCELLPSGIDLNYYPRYFNLAIELIPGYNHALPQVLCHSASGCASEVGLYWVDFKYFEVVSCWDVNNQYEVSLERYRIPVFNEINADSCSASVSGCCISGILPRPSGSEEFNMCDFISETGIESRYFHTPIELIQGWSPSSAQILCHNVDSGVCSGTTTGLTNSYLWWATMHCFDVMHCITSSESESCVVSGNIYQIPVVTAILVTPTAATPTPTQSPTVSASSGIGSTPTGSFGVTATPTPTPDLTAVTPTPYPSQTYITPTIDLSPTSTVIPTPTPSVTPSITPTRCSSCTVISGVIESGVNDNRYFDLPIELIPNFNPNVPQILSHNAIGYTYDPSGECSNDYGLQWADLTCLEVVTDISIVDSIITAQRKAIPVLNEFNKYDDDRCDLTITCPTPTTTATPTVTATPSLTPTNTPEVTPTPSVLVPEPPVPPISGDCPIGYDCTIPEGETGCEGLCCPDGWYICLNYGCPAYGLCTPPTDYGYALCNCETPETPTSSLTSIPASPSSTPTATPSMTPTMSCTSEVGANQSPIIRPVEYCCEPTEHFIQIVEDPVFYDYCICCPDGWEYCTNINSPLYGRCYEDTYNNAYICEFSSFCN